VFPAYPLLFCSHLDLLLVCTVIGRSLFTKIIKGDIPSSKVAEGDGWYAFLDINPRRPGHTLVVPKEEKQRIAELTPASRAAIMEGVAEAQRKLTAVFNTVDFQVSVHDGPTAGQEVPHVHIHVIPREPGDGGRNMLAMWPKAPPIGSAPPDFAALGALADKLQAA
jgi:histidine triad (HIT) family protein